MEYTLPKRVRFVKCLSCGKEFTSRFHNENYCPRCAKLRYGKGWHGDSIGHSIAKKKMPVIDIDNRQHSYD